MEGFEDFMFRVFFGFTALAVLFAVVAVTGSLIEALGVWAALAPVGLAALVGVSWLAGGVVMRWLD